MTGEPKATPPSQSSPDGDADPAETVARLRDLLAAAGRLAEFGRFAAQQIHELRQPLFAIKGLAQLLLEKDRVELDEVLGFARHIVEQSERLTALCPASACFRCRDTDAAARRDRSGARARDVAARFPAAQGRRPCAQIAPDVPLLAISSTRWNGS